jgi:hypothetical protein
LDRVVVACGFGIQVRQTGRECEGIERPQAVLFELAEDLKKTAHIDKTIRRECRISAQ